MWIKEMKNKELWGKESLKNVKLEQEMNVEL